jgi:drug/metabolite transporter (DMT)-like permease
MVYILALACALSNALASILQRMGVEDAPDRDTLRLSLVTHALKRGIWLLGFVFIVATFLLQSVALHIGRLSQVQPVLTTELLFIVIFLATWFRFRIGLREWLGCLAAAGGLAGFLAFAQPGGGKLVPTAFEWTVSGSVGGGIVLVTVLLALRGPRWWRAFMFGTAGAVGFAFAAALIKVVSDYVTTDWTRLFFHWQTYALIVCGVGALSLWGQPPHLRRLRPAGGSVAGRHVRRSRLDRPFPPGIRDERRRRPLRRIAVVPFPLQAIGQGGPGSAPRRSPPVEPPVTGGRLARRRTGQTA